MKRSRTPCAVYRCWDAQDRLLYVGQSVAPEDRWLSHARLATWAAQVTRRDVEWYSSCMKAAQAEAAAIRTEKPVHNVRRESRFDTGLWLWLWRRRSLDYTARAATLKTARRAPLPVRRSGWAAVAVSVLAVLAYFQHLLAIEWLAAMTTASAVPGWVGLLAVTGADWGVVVAGLPWFINRKLPRRESRRRALIGPALWAAAWCCAFGAHYGVGAAWLGLLVLVVLGVAAQAVISPSPDRSRQLVVPSGSRHRGASRPAAPSKPPVAPGELTARGRAFVLQFVVEHQREPTGSEVDAAIGSRDSFGRKLLARMRKAGDLPDLAATG